MCYTVYILYSESLDLFYKGQTKDLTDRLFRHNHGREKSTKPGIPWMLVWFTTKKSRSDAVALEAKLKNMSKKNLASFINRHSEGIAGPDDPDR